MTTWISGGPVAREVHSTHTEQHGTIGGNPTFNATIAVAWSELEEAVSLLLGGPEIWPKATSIIETPVCVSVRVNNDRGRYTTDSNGEVINYNIYALLDLTYMARGGGYVTGKDGQDLFWNDEVGPRIESRPMNHNLLIWGNQGGSGLPSQKVQLTPDEVPSKYENGTSLTHTIEGWNDYTDDLTDLISTTNQDPYSSPLTGVVYNEGTLLLRDYAEIPAYNFISYRTGVIGTNLKLFYEFKKEGWQVFWRNDLVGKTTGYYAIHQADDPYNQVLPFPMADHTRYLDWIP